MDSRWSVSGPDKTFHVSLIAGYAWSDAIYKRAWLRTVGNDIAKNPVPGQDKQPVLVEFYNKAMKPNPLLTPQQGRTILRWVQEEMKLKTIFVIDSKRVDRQRQQARKADQKRRKTAAAAIGREATILATARGSQRSVLTHNKLAVEAAKAAGVTKHDLGILRAAFPTCPKTSNAYNEIKKRAQATGDFLLLGFLLLGVSVLLPACLFLFSIFLSNHLHHHAFTPAGAPIGTAKEEDHRGGCIFNHVSDVVYWLIKNMNIPDDQHIVESELLDWGDGIPVSKTRTILGEPFSSAVSFSCSCTC